MGSTKILFHPSTETNNKLHSAANALGVKPCSLGLTRPVKSRRALELGLSCIQVSVSTMRLRISCDPFTVVDKIGRRKGLQNAGDAWQAGTTVAGRPLVLQVTIETKNRNNE